MEQTLILLKPDTVQRGLVGQVLSAIENKGFQLVGMKLLQLTQEMAGELYAPHKGKPFYEPVVEYMTSGPIVALCLGGTNVIATMRVLMGATNPAQADPGSIRGRFAHTIDRNIIHGSDSPENAERELKIFFSAAERLNYNAAFTQWVKP